MNRGGKRKTSKKTYKKKNGKKYKKYNKTSSYPNVQFIKKVKKVVNNTLHPEKKRYNCFRVSATPDMNSNWAINGISVSSLDTNNIHVAGDSSDSGVRSPWYWHQLNTRPVLASSDTYYSIEGSKMFLKYIYIKGHIRFTMLNANNASAKELMTRIGNLRLKIACIRGDTNYNINDYRYLNDNIIQLETNKKNFIDLTTDVNAWKNYHYMTRKQYLYKNLKIWTAKKWKWSRWNKAQSAQGAIAEGSGTIVSHADTGGAELMVPFTYILRVNKNIIYKKETGNAIGDRDDCNLKYFYCFESDCGIENAEYQVQCGAVGVFTDC